jgi:hypothetical protein
MHKVTKIGLADVDVFRELPLRWPSRMPDGTFKIAHSVLRHFKPFLISKIFLLKKKRRTVKAFYPQRRLEALTAAAEPFPAEACELRGPRASYLIQVI